MSVLIKGMDMPICCAECPMLEGDRMDGLCRAASRWLDDDEFWTWYVYPEGDIDDNKPCNCPLAYVPPHGDLIERDEMFVEFVLEGQKSTRYKIGEKWELNGEEIRRVIQRFPTIIEAEEVKK